MPAAARSRLCSRVSAWACVFIRSAISSAQCVFVIDFEGYLLLLSFASLKPSSFIISTDVLSTQSRQMIKRYGANVSPCITPTKLKQSVSPSGSGLVFSCFYISSLLLRRFLWVGRRRVVFSPSSLCVWSQRSWRSRQIILLRQGFCMYTLNSIYSPNL